MNKNPEPITILELLSLYPGGIDALAKDAEIARSSVYNLATRRFQRAPMQTIRAIARAWAKRRSLRPLPAAELLRLVKPRVAS